MNSALRLSIKHQTRSITQITLGIDSNEVDKEEYNCFTKTYRDLHKVKEIIELPEEVNKIYFYGHSLATADFSYFYSLFDMYKLYDGFYFLNCNLLSNILIF